MKNVAGSRKNFLLRKLGQSPGIGIRTSQTLFIHLGYLSRKKGELVINSPYARNKIFTEMLSRKILVPSK